MKYDERAGDQPLVFREQPENEMIASVTRSYQQMDPRRSVRDFSDRSVPSAVIEQAMLEACTAPGGANKQPWHFAFTMDPEVKAISRGAVEQEEREFYQRRAGQEWLDAMAPLGTDANKRARNCFGVNWRVYAKDCSER